MEALSVIELQGVAKADRAMASRSPQLVRRYCDTDAALSHGELTIFDFEDAIACDDEVMRRTRLPFE